MTAPGYIPPVAPGWWPKNNRLVKEASIESTEKFGNITMVMISTISGIASLVAFGVATVFDPSGGNASSAGTGNLNGGNAASTNGGSADGGTA